MVLAADPWCPYNCVPDSNHPGYFVELATLAFEQHGHTVKYVNMPWSRAIRMARKGVIDGIIGTGREETPDFIYPQYSHIDVKHSFYTLKQSEWHYGSVASLGSVRLGVLNDYSYGDFLEEYLQVNENNIDRLIVVYNDEGLPQLVRLLKAGRIDAFIEERGVVNDYVRNRPEDDFLKFAGVGSPEQVSIAFSPVKPTSQKYAQLLSDAFVAIEGTELHLKLLQKYQLVD
ncbi:MAG: transporter substrate-binding domain-containing protein [Motiliproteus sp.]